MEVDSKKKRPHNDRFFLNLVRNNGPMSKAGLTRLSGLSAQSATVIVNRLVEQKLLKAGQSIKGKVGQPSTPYLLNPDGAYSIGVKIGRRSLEVGLMSFDYEISDRIVYHYEFPRYKTVRQKMSEFIAEIINNLSDTQKQRLLGIGISIPDDLSAWETVIGASEGDMAEWADAQLAEDLTEEFNLPVDSLNDVSAACLAEIALGNTGQSDSFLYIYVGSFIGGGIAIENKLYKGRHNLAGSIASMPASFVSEGVAGQLLDGTSLNNLEIDAASAGIDPMCFYEQENLDQDAKHVFDNWMKGAAPMIAFAAVSAQAVIDTDAIIIDSSLSPSLQRELFEMICASIENNYDDRGMAEIKVDAGVMGISARVIGSGILPFLSEFSYEN